MLAVGLFDGDRVAVAVRVRVAVCVPVAVRVPPVTGGRVRVGVAERDGPVACVEEGVWVGVAAPGEGLGVRDGLAVIVDLPGVDVSGRVAVTV